MTVIEQAAGFLDGRQYGDEVNPVIEKFLKDNNLVAVFGYSDDCMEFEGSIRDEFYGIVYLNKKGIVKLCDEGEDCPHQQEALKNAKSIEPLWCAEPGISWTYKTDIEHKTFNIFEDQDLYCRGIVFSMDSL